MNKFVVTSSPHIASKDTTRGIMTDVIIALIPSGIAASVMFGWYTAVLIVSCVAACVLFEFLTRKILKRPNTIGDLSAVVTGLILAYNLPPAFPIWMALIGCFVAIVIVKQCFGGIGQNFANPAATARIVLLASFPTFMSTWTLPFSKAVDAVSSATPLAIMKSGAGLTLDRQTVLSLLLGFDGGSLGEISRLLLLLGGLYLILRRVITPTVPLAYIGTVFVLSWALGANPVLQILSGGLILGAFFMATDYATSPLTQKGKLVFGIGCGVFTVLIRLYSNLPEGVSYSILLMNILTPLIERAVYPKPFGTVKTKKAAKGGDAK